VSANPWMKFYPSDWRSDPKLRMCSIAARGLWMELICIMHEADPYGHLLINRKPPSDTQLGALTGADSITVRTLLSELEAVGVFSRNRAGVIYSRRMVADEKKARTARANGAKGGDVDLNALADGAQRGKRFNRKDNPTKVQAVWAACDGRCTVCGQQMDFHHRNEPNSFEIDHRIPLTQGGTNDLENLRGCCKSCNLAEAKRLGKLRRCQAEGHPSPNPAANGAANPQKPDSRVQKEKEGGGGAGAHEAGEYVAGKTGLKVQACIDRAAKWIAAGFDVQADIIPTVDDLVKSAKRPIGSPNYFDGAIRRHHEERLAPLPEALPSNVSYLPRAAGGRQAPSNAMSPAARDLMAAYRDPNFDYGVGR
jgi:hypothetical protein